MRIRAAILATAVAVSLLTFGPAHSVPAGFVTRYGSQLMVDGHPWQAIGVNFWDMDAYKALANDLTGCYYQHPDLDAYFDASFKQIALTTHATVVRTFGFREQYTAAGQDWSSTDKLLYYARKYNIRVIPSFGDQFAECGTPYKLPTWYHCVPPQPLSCTPGYKQPSVWGQSYREYVVAAVRRYKDDPTVAWWQLMNEPMYGIAATQADQTALADFSRDMVHAIRDEAGDTNHMVATGTTGQRGYTGFSPNGMLLDCTATSGGCSDLSEIHDYSRVAPLQGEPLLSTAAARIITSNQYDADYVSPPVNLTIDGWTTITANMPTRPAGRPDLYWSVLLTFPRSPGFTFYADDGVVMSATGPTSYQFESDTDGFRADGADVSQSSEQPKTGFGSLKGVTPFGAEQVRIYAPVLPGPARSVQLSLRVRFDGPAAEEAGGIAGVLHTAVIRHLKPFFTGELGIPAQVAGAPNQYGLPDAPLDQCTTNTTLVQRAQTYDQMIGFQTDADHRSGGLIVWDFKDPTQLPVDANGTPIPDPMISCYSVTPTDPTTAVLKTYADTVTPAPLPAVGDVPQGVPFLAVLTAPPPSAGTSADLPIRTRLTNGGDVVRGASIVASGGCTGSGTTNALGIADFTCRTANVIGSSDVTINVVPATCACTLPAQVYSLSLKHRLQTAVVSGVAVHGQGAPLQIAIKSTDGSSVRGVPYSIEGCGIGGVIADNVDSVVINTTCPTGTREGTSIETLKVAETSTTLASASPFVLLVFDSVWRDPVNGDCVGLSPESGWMGATESSHACSVASSGSPSGWFSFQVPAKDRTRAFTQTGTLLVASGSVGSRRIAGAFDSATGLFSAVVSRRDGTTLVSNP